MCLSLGWRDTRKRDNYFEICTASTSGPWPTARAPSGCPLPRPPSRLEHRHPGQVEIQELFMQFSGDLCSDEPNAAREVDEYRISSEELDL